LRFTIFEITIGWPLELYVVKEEIKKRTKQIGLDVIKLIDILPSKISSRAIANQLIRCSTSIGANYRAACRAKSGADFINKLKIVEEETDETIYWLEILEESGLIKSEETERLKRESNEILSIVVASINTIRNKANCKES
jgi:four helix bundle protein